MRVKAIICAAGERWTADFPKIDEKACFPLVNDGTDKRTVNGEAVRQALNQPEYITHSGRDTAYLQAIAAMWIAKVNSWKDDNQIGRDVKDFDKTMTRIERRCESAKITYARADWYVVAPGDQTKVRITITNDGIVEKQPWERLFAWIMAEAAQVVSENIVEHGCKPIIFTPETEKLLSDLAEWRKDRQAEHDEKAKKVALDEKRALCPYRTASGYCSPCQFGCELFSEGGLCGSTKQLN